MTSTEPTEHLNNKASARRLSGLPENVRKMSVVQNLNDGKGNVDAEASVRSLVQVNKDNKTLAKATCAMGIAGTGVVGSTFCLAIVANNLAKETVVNPQTGFATVKGGDAILKTSEALVMIPGVNPALMDIADLPSVKKVHIGDNISLDVKGYGLSGDKEVMLLTEGGRLTFHKENGIVDAAGDALTLLENGSNSDVIAVGNKGRRRLPPLEKGSVPNMSRYASTGLTVSTGSLGASLDGSLGGSSWGSSRPDSFPKFVLSSLKPLLKSLEKPTEEKQVMKRMEALRDELDDFFNKNPHCVVQSSYEADHTADHEEITLQDEENTNADKHDSHSGSSNHVFIIGPPGAGIRMGGGSGATETLKHQINVLVTKLDEMLKKQEPQSLLEIAQELHKKLMQFNGCLLEEEYHQRLQAECKNRQNQLRIIEERSQSFSYRRSGSVSDSSDSDEEEEEEGKLRYRNREIIKEGDACQVLQHLKCQRLARQHIEDEKCQRLEEEEEERAASEPERQNSLEDKDEEPRECRKSLKFLLTNCM